MAFWVARANTLGSIRTLCRKGQGRGAQHRERRDGQRSRRIRTLAETVRAAVPGGLRGVSGSLAPSCTHEPLLLKPPESHSVGKKIKRRQEQFLPVNELVIRVQLVDGQRVQIRCWWRGLQIGDLRSRGKIRDFKDRKASGPGQKAPGALSYSKGGIDLSQSN